jgi:hypothetical protein
MISIKDLPKEVKDLYIDTLTSLPRLVDGAIIRRKAYTISQFGAHNGLKVSFHVDSLDSDLIEQLISDYYRARKGAK